MDVYIMELEREVAALKKRVSELEKQVQAPIDKDLLKAALLEMLEEGQFKAEYSA